MKKNTKEDIQVWTAFGIGIYVNGKFNSLVDRLNNNKEVKGDESNK